MISKRTAIRDPSAYWLRFVRSQLAEWRKAISFAPSTLATAPSELSGRVVARIGASSRSPVAISTTSFASCAGSRGRFGCLAIALHGAHKLQLRQGWEHFKWTHYSLLLRTKIARVIEIHLKGCRDKAEFLDDPLLLYLIDIALLQLRRKRLQTNN